MVSALATARTAVARRQPLVQRIAPCHCGYPIYFRNHLCLHCGRALGDEPETATLLSLDPAGDGTWHVAGTATTQDRAFQRCANFDSASQCNWLVPVADAQTQSLCRCCRLNRTIPDQSIATNAVLWHKVEIAKRRLVSSLIALGLPVASRVSEDTQRGLAFDLLVATGPAPIMTGHDNGIITLNVDEADDAQREAIRTALQEPYRTLLGHARHESGHYYWSRLLQDSSWHAPFRALFGDEREDYDQALEKHYANGPAPLWANNYVSAYASAHPWEDWAETWAHYLHMVDTLDTAVAGGIGSNGSSRLKKPFDKEALYARKGEKGKADPPFLACVNAWAGLTTTLNELSQSMGLPDYYPFALSKLAVTKLHFVHRFIHEAQTRPPCVGCGTDTAPAIE